MPLIASHTSNAEAAGAIVSVAFWGAVGILAIAALLILTQLLLALVRMRRRPLRYVLGALATSVAGFTALLIAFSFLGWAACDQDCETLSTAEIVRGSWYAVGLLVAASGISALLLWIIYLRQPRRAAP